MTYQLDGTGWADARIGNGESSVDITVSYLDDSLRKLGELALALQRGEEKGTVSFLDEPGEHILVLTRVRNELHFKVHWHDDWISTLEDIHESNVVLYGTTNIDEFVASVRQQLEALLDRHGEKGYKALWVNHDFPADVLSELRSSAL